MSEGRVRLLVPESTGAGLSAEEAEFDRAVSVLSCGSYRNQLLHVFVRSALLAVAIHTADSSRRGERLKPD
ncbi:MAG: hypothetical protein ACRC4N_09825 [Gammaproteobacteria bacterium]